METQLECPKCSLMILTNQFESHQQKCNIQHPKLNYPIFSQQKLQQQQHVQLLKPINISKALAEQRMAQSQKVAHMQGPQYVAHQIQAQQQFQEQEYSYKYESKDPIINLVPRCGCCKQTQPKEIFQLQYLDQHKQQNNTNTQLTIPLITSNQQPPTKVVLQPPHLGVPKQMQTQNLRPPQHRIVIQQDIKQRLPQQQTNQERNYEDVYQKQKQLNIDKMTDEQIYEYFTELDQQNRIGLQKKQIDKLVRYKYTPDLKVNECNICQEEYNVGESVCRLSCVHLFHHECLSQWLAVSKQCPICKFEVNL